MGAGPLLGCAVAAPRRWDPAAFTVWLQKITRNRGCAWVRKAHYRRGLLEGHGALWGAEPPGHDTPGTGGAFVCGIGMPVDAAGLDFEGFFAGLRPNGYRLVSMMKRDFEPRMLHHEWLLPPSALFYG